MFNDDELEEMAADLNESLPDTCVIRGYTSVSDDMGGFTDTYAASDTVACRISPDVAGASESDVGARFTGVQLWTITLPANTSVDGSDRITSGSRTFEIVSTFGPRSYEVSRRLVVKEAT